MDKMLCTPREVATDFIANGRSIRRGVLIPSMRMLDIAPTIAKLLGCGYSLS